MQELIFYSNNINKIKEVSNIFKSIKVKIFSPRDFKLDHEPKEIGYSFASNAKIKSSFGYRKLQIPCFAEDSGISIEALGWKPNIYSKRFINNFKNNSECFKYIFNEVKKSQKNRAQFQTSVCLTIKENYHIAFEGKIDGRISSKAVGKLGFGYDPIFIPDGLSKTYGEISNKEKNIVSHRAVAIRKLINFLSN